jgi:hypothetical protein
MKLNLPPPIRLEDSNPHSQQARTSEPILLKSLSGYPLEKIYKYKLLTGKNASSYL